MNRKQRRASESQSRPPARISSNAHKAQQTAEAGITCHRAGQLAEAEKLYTSALALDPKNANFMYLRGTIYLQTGRNADGINEIGAALALNSNSLSALNRLYALNNLGLALREQGRLSEAVTCFTEALRLKSDYPEALNNLGVTLKELGRLDEAIARYGEALRLKPDYPEVLNNLGVAYQEQGRLDDSAACFTAVLRLRPEYPEALYNFGGTLQEQGRVEDAIARFTQALRLKPDYPEALYNLGVMLQEQGRLDDAIARYTEALRLTPDFPDALCQLVHQFQHSCSWKDLASKSEQVLGLVRQHRAGLTPFDLLALPATPADQLDSARVYSRQQNVPAEAKFRHDPERRQHGRIRVGYLSADFHQHPMALLMSELFERHDRTRFETYAYSFGPEDNSEARQRLVAAFDHFTDIRRLSHHEAAERIYQDEIDILIDRKGYTRNARPRILAYRPSPVQVNYLAYPATMGADFIDYLIADPFLIPERNRAFYSEAIVRLPDCYQPNDTRRRIAEPTPSRAECGLPEQGLVFCCFNNTYKITPDFFDVWMRLLRATPGSVLWLLEANASVKNNLRREAQARDVEPDRLIFAPKLPNPEHLARHRLADLFLDNLPFNAHTGTSDALWAGLPVLTCVGETFAGRVAGSLLTAVGLPEMITETLPDYEALALKLASAPAALAAIRRKLGENRATAPLFDIMRYTRNLEIAYGRMWELYCAGRVPEPIEV
ncbi:MAG: tetratricopeptide repeat protein [Alphaproteobacteria bacterium]|nr:tetratricopeptide repeat protein [Alphaproteobacteria bacterium]